MVRAPRRIVAKRHGLALPGATTVLLEIHAPWWLSLILLEK